MRRKALFLFLFLTFFTILLNIPSFPIVHGKTWTFLETSMYTDYKVTLTTQDVWEVGKEYTITLEIEVTDSTKNGYLVISIIELGPVLKSKTDSVDLTLHVGDLYTHQT